MPDKRRSPLNMLETLPLSAFFETSMTGTKVPQPGTQNWNFQFPQDISLFLAGAWTYHVGSFLQVTYEVQDDHFTMDNTDIRYANKTTVSGKELDYGLTLNNNPTLEDLWNSTPAWGYPFIATERCSRPSRGADHQWAAGSRCGGIGRVHHVGPARVLCRNPVSLRPYWRYPAHNWNLLHL